MTTSRLVGTADVTIMQALHDPELLGRVFPSLSSWKAWQAFLKALFGLRLSKAEMQIFRKHTARNTVPRRGFKEAWLPTGRRAGKSRIAALVAVYLACFKDHRRVLAAGERGTVMLLAADRRQARTLFRYVEGMLETVPMLSQMIQQRNKESVDLANGVTIEIHTASFRAVRGYTVIGAICDEIAFWRNEDSANPDKEIVNGLRPGMSTVPDSLLVCISSPYARRGMLWETYKRYYGEESESILVWQADTRSMNPTVPERIIEEAYEQDDVAASAEYGAEFRRDIEGFVSRESVEACVITGRQRVPPRKNICYEAFCDPSGGSADSMTLGIAHEERGTSVLDLVLERRPPFSPEDVVEEFCSMLALYGIYEVSGDRYGGEWPREQFRRRGVSYQPAERTKSELYRDVLPMLNSGRVELLDNKRLLMQLVGLERRPSRSGRDTVDHGPGAHDDLINAAAGALVSTRRSRVEPGLTWI